MKKAIFVLLMVTLLVVPMTVNAGKPDKCTTIQSGELLAGDGTPLTVGYDQWGYNYQALMFNGDYCAYDRDASDCGAVNDHLSMKWNEAWLSNVDCDGDGLLDRHFGFDSYIGSGAWLTNHMNGVYQDGDQLCEWDYFVKIVAAPADAINVNGYWVAASGTEIGPAIWGAFAIIQEVENDPCAGVEGVLYRSPAHPGMGNW